MLTGLSVDCDVVSVFVHPLKSLNKNLIDDPSDVLCLHCPGVLFFDQGSRDRKSLPVCRWLGGPTIVRLDEIISYYKVSVLTVE